MTTKTFTILAVAMISAEKYEVTVKSADNVTTTLPATAAAAAGLTIGSKVKIPEGATTFPQAAPVAAKKHSPDFYARESAH